MEKERSPLLLIVTLHSRPGWMMSRLDNGIRGYKRWLREGMARTSAFICSPIAAKFLFFSFFFFFSNSVMASSLYPAIRYFHRASSLTGFSLFTGSVSRVERFYDCIFSNFLFLFFFSHFENAAVKMCEIFFRSVDFC